jgi:hypothetical protein
VLGQCALARRLDGPFAGLMEKIMSKSNDSSKLGRTTPTPDLGGANTFTVRELRDDELENVSGGWHQSVVEGQIAALRRVSIASSEVFELNT